MPLMGMRNTRDILMYGCGTLPTLVILQDSLKVLVQDVAFKRFVRLLKIADLDSRGCP